MDDRRPVLVCPCLSLSVLVCPCLSLSELRSGRTGDAIRRGRDGASAAVRLDRTRNWRVLGYREVGAHRLHRLLYKRRPLGATRTFQRRRLSFLRAGDIMAKRGASAVRMLSVSHYGLSGPDSREHATALAEPAASAFAQAFFPPRPLISQPPRAGRSRLAASDATTARLGIDQPEALIVFSISLTSCAARRLRPWSPKSEPPTESGGVPE